MSEKDKKETSDGRAQVKDAAYEDLDSEIENKVRRFTENPALEPFRKWQKWATEQQTIETQNSNYNLTNRRGM